MAQEIQVAMICARKPAIVVTEDDRSGLITEVYSVFVPASTREARLLENVFYHGWMAETAAERVLAARITGTAMRYARGRPLAETEEAEALASITEVAAGRTDLLAQAAGLAIGFYQGTLNEPQHRQAADLLIKAGADQELIAGWVEEGRRRAEATRGIPYTGA
jgi:hypothetical protein